MKGLLRMAMKALVTGGMALGALLPAASSASAQPVRHERHEMTPSRVEVRSAEGPVTIPFRLVGNLVVIPITIRKTALDVILDTGMPMDGVMLYRNDKVGRLDLKPEEGVQAKVGGAGGDGGAVAAEIVPGLTIDVGGVRISEARAIVTPAIRPFAAHHDGVIGAALFRNFVVGIDFDAGRITLHDPKGWTPPEGGSTVPLKIEGNLPYAEVAILAPDGRRVPSTVVVDLGAAHAISLNVGTIEGLEVPQGAIRTVIGRGLGGMLRGQVARIAGLELGGVVLRDVVATFPDEEHQRPGGMDQRSGNLGNGLLQHFNVAFDYPHGRMLLSPNQGFSRPFEWDMSGLAFEPDGKSGLKIAWVVADSAAAQAGFRVGDVVSRVNERKVTSADLFALGQQLRQEGGTVAIKVERDGKPVEATLRLKRLV